MFGVTDAYWDCRLRVAVYTCTGIATGQGYAHVILITVENDLNT